MCNRSEHNFVVNNLVTMFNEYDIQQAEIFRRSTLLICYKWEGGIRK